MTSGGGGGGCGEVVVGYVYLTEGEITNVIVGAGGIPINGPALIEATGWQHGATSIRYCYQQGFGGVGAESGEQGFIANTGVVLTGPGGNGGSNGTGYGGGGGGCSGGKGGTADTPIAMPGQGRDNGQDAPVPTNGLMYGQLGGVGGPGAVFVEYSGSDDGE